jgi:glycosyltransferase involved in cell wall biosynthesis
MIPRASFVIPAYNADRWISKALYSCRTQTIKNIEIIVVNDGSTDYTQAIAEWHAEEDKRIKVFNRTNQGRSSSRNYGNSQALSDLILVLDADDMATRNRVKNTLTIFELKKPDFLYGSFFSIDSMGTTMSKIVCGPFDPEVSKQKKLNFICHSTVAYTKKLAQSIYYEEGVYSELGLDDWKFQWEVYKRGYKIQHIRNPLCYYRVTESGTMGTRDPKAVETAKDEFLATV